MSDRQSPFHGWRARTHYLTRNRHFLLRTSAAIVAVGLAIACLVVVAHVENDAHLDKPGISEADNIIHREYHKLRSATSPQPRQLAGLLRLLLKQIDSGTPEETEALATFRSSGKLAGYDLAEFWPRHASSDAPAGLFHDFIIAALGGDAATWKRLEQRAAAVPHEMLAAELCGSVKKRQGDAPAAMRFFHEEGLHFSDAAASREEALRLAVVARDLPMIRAMAAEPGWIENCPPLLQQLAGAMLNDVWMQWHGLVYHQLTDIPYGMLALALLAAGLWYFILVQHGDRVRWRWVRPLPALLAGVISVWPTLIVLSYQEFSQGMTSEAPFPYDLIYYVLGVGLREEGCKLALFAFFLPWLLWRRQPGLALLTGAFVGLGFSLEENVGYYQEHGGAIALTRFLSANFIHISLTALCSHSLYNMLSTRFARADEFIATFAAVVAVHGGYDWLLSGGMGDNSWLSFVLLVLTVSRFIDLLGSETRPARLTIAPRAVFTFGSALLVAISFILAAWGTHSMEGVASAGIECLAMVPIAILYWRKFENV